MIGFLPSLAATTQKFTNTGQPQKTDPTRPRPTVGALLCLGQVGPTGNAGAVVSFDGAGLQRYRRPGTYAAFRSASNVIPSTRTGRRCLMATLTAACVTWCAFATATQLG